MIRGESRVKRKEKKLEGTKGLRKRREMRDLSEEGKAESDFHGTTSVIIQRRVVRRTSSEAYLSPAGRETSS
jgi:hypothetical protein